MLRRLVGGGVIAFLIVLGGVPAVAIASAPSHITNISGRCTGQNAEVLQATWHDYVYEEWMGCGSSIGFARSADGGRTWSRPVTLAGSLNAWDPGVTTAPDGTVYAAFMNSDSSHTYPVVETSFDHGRTFSSPVRLVPPDLNNWGDRDFIVAGPHGVLYLTWDYGPSAAAVTDICTPGGSCAFATGDLNVVIQKSTDYGRTWSAMEHVSPGFPASGGDSAPMVLEPSGAIDMQYQGYNIYNLNTYAMNPASAYFTRSTDGGATWSPPVQIAPSAGTMSLAEWWIDGAIGADAAGNLYITWDTQNDVTGTDIGWLSYSVNHGRTWSPGIRVTPDTDNAPHIVQPAGGRPGIAYVGWLSDSSPNGYAQYLRTFAIGRGWLDSPRTVSRQHGKATVWPGDTFGISMLPGNTVMLAWGSAVAPSPNSEIYAARIPG